MIQFACPKCQTALSATDAQCGTKVACPKCNQRILVPQEDDNRTLPGQLLPRKPAPVAAGAAAAIIKAAPPPMEKAGAQAVSATANPQLKVEEWYYTQAGKQCGPVTWPQLRYLAASGQVTPAERVWTKGMASWTGAKSVQGLFTTDGGARRPSASAGRRRPGSSGRWLIIGGSSVAAAGLATFLLILFLNRDGKGQGTPAPDKGETDHKPFITSFQQDELSGAMGFLVNGATVTERSGEQYVVQTGGTASCFAISADGYLLTNRHAVVDTWKLINSADKLKRLREEKGIDVKPMIWVFFAGKKYDAKILHLSDKFDMSILKIQRTDGPFFEVSSTDKLRRSTKVFALGFPDSSLAPLSEDEKLLEASRRRKKNSNPESLFQKRDFVFVQTTGSVARVIAEEVNGRRWVQHDATINPGNSGGPLINEHGVVLAINTLGIPGRDPRSTRAFYALALPQLKEELSKHVPTLTWEP